MTLPITETVKDVIQKAEARTRAQFIAHRKEVLIKKWWDEFEDLSNGKNFEELYTGWEIDAHFGILSRVYKIPSLEDCGDALNDGGCTFERFSNYFLENLIRY